MGVYGPDDDELDYDYEVGAEDQDDGATGVTIRPVYGSEAADYLAHLFSGHCPSEALSRAAAPPDVPPPAPAEPVSLRDKLLAWFPDR